MAIQNIMGSLLSEAKRLAKEQPTGKLTRQQFVSLWQKRRTKLNTKKSSQAKIMAQKSYEKQQKASEATISKANNVMDQVLTEGPFSALSSWLASGFYRKQPTFNVELKVLSQKGQEAEFIGIPKTDLFRMQKQEMRMGTYLWNNPTTRPQMIQNKQKGFK